MTPEDMIHTVYSAFNRRDVDAVLALMTPDVSWPKASEGGRVVGKEEIRAYWSRQWAEFNPVVEPLEVTPRGDGRLQVRVHQLVRTLGGDLLSDLEVLHVYTLQDGLICRMDLDESVSAFSPAQPG